MLLGAVRYRRFRWALPDMSALVKHFPAGVLMGLGTALALGGNDFQLLLGLPASSAAALVSTVAMLLVIALVLQGGGRTVPVKT